MAGIILCADIGTSALKAAFISLDGKLLAFNREAYERREGVDAALWELAFARSLEKLHAQAPDCVPDGICVSGNGPTLAPLTDSGETLAPLFWYDGRRIPPKESAPSFFLPQAAWLKKNAPREYEKTRVFLSPHEWLSHRLGADALAVLPSASYEACFWNEQQCRLFGLDREKFPPFIHMGSVMGKVSQKAAARFGPASGNRLKSGTPIIAGGTDFITALIGTGTLRPGDVCDRAGSSEGINVCAASPVEAKGLRVLPHAKEGLWNIGKLIPSSGRLFEQYRISSAQEARPYQEHLAELLPSTDTTELFRGLDPCAVHCPLSLGRAVLCAIGFAVRDAVEVLASSGFPVREMKVSGGQAKNPRWNQLKADITGITLLIPEIPDGELAGNAVLSAAALGAASTIEEAADKMIRVNDSYKPRPEAAPFWEERYALYRESG
ncbi:MAG: FGGY-family carbohydrate kinase [Treponema sp.]|nr:FGGY-family carbohydrate kinase [Treponema sp.]